MADPTGSLSDSKTCTSLSPLPDLLDLFMDAFGVPVVSGLEYGSFDRVLRSHVLLASGSLFVLVELARAVDVPVAQGVQWNAIAVIALECSVEVTGRRDECARRALIAQVLAVGEQIAPLGARDALVVRAPILRVFLALPPLAEHLITSVTAVVDEVAVLL